MSEHRWSGWPGAWCLDCGAEDQNEICISTHDVLLQCVEGHIAGDGHPDARCAVHVNGPCLHPGEGLADPYRIHGFRRKAWEWFERNGHAIVAWRRIVEES